MSSPQPLCDRPQLLRQRARALRQGPALFLHEEAAIEVQERLIDVNRSFTTPAIITGFADFWAERFPQARIVADDEVLDLELGGHDLVIHAMALHWANDPVGQLVQCRRALRADGLFIGAFLGGQTLSELRAVLGTAEAQVCNGLSPRVAPMGDIRDVGGLLQRAGLALPVADLVRKTVSYASPLHLMRDLRAMGEGNALAQRHRKSMPRRLLHKATDVYPSDHRSRVTATFEMLFLSGWAPDPSQQQPLRPGSAKTRLADALETAELGRTAIEKDR